MKPKPDNADLLESRTIEMKPNSYQPSKAEKEEENDMPEASVHTVRSAFFRPIEAKSGAE